MNAWCGAALAATNVLTILRRPLIPFTTVSLDSQAVDGRRGRAAREAPPLEPGSLHLVGVPAGDLAPLVDPLAPGAIPGVM
jgi:hypothetical protein